MFNLSHVSGCRYCCFVGLALLSLAVAAGEAEKLKAPGAFLLTASQRLDPAECRTKALDSEKTEDWAAALALWERVIDRCQSTEDQRVEARSHIKELHAKVARNTDPEKARPWKVLVVIFRKLDFSWTDDKGTRFEVQKTVNEADEKKIRGSIEAFGKHVFHHSSGMLRLDTDIKVVDEHLTKPAGRAGEKPLGLIRRASGIVAFAQ